MHLLKILAVLCLASAAHAQTCTFTTECFEADGCSDTNYEITINGDTLVTISDTIPVQVSSTDTTTVYTGIKGTIAHMLSVNSDGPARYTSHIFGGPLVISYIGACE